MGSFKATWEFLKGKKTFILSFLGVIVTGLFSQGYIDETLFTSFMTILGSLGFATIRSAIK
jgi:hypothetical protein